MKMLQSSSPFVIIIIKPILLFQLRSIFNREEKNHLQITPFHQNGAVPKNAIV